MDPKRCKIEVAVEFLQRKNRAEKRLIKLELVERNSYGVSNHGLLLYGQVRSIAFPYLQIADAFLVKNQAKEI
jgi:hypothetical protein